jgi:transcriptional regulator with XRE-family HTH domain
MTTSIGDRMCRLREFRDMTQEELAQRAGVSVDTIRKREQGVRQSARLNTLRLLARALVGAAAAGPMGGSTVHRRAESGRA